VNKTIRAELLEEANKILHGRRSDDYGSIESNFGQIAALWNIYLERRKSIEPHDVCAMMALLKIARLSHKPDYDGALDLAGYAACYAEAAKLAPPVSETAKSKGKARK
jgi:hypothetical protein